MKKIRLFLVSLMVFVFGVVSCDHDQLLNENPEDFLTPKNSFTDKAGFESALAAIYRANRNFFYEAPALNSRYVFGFMGVDLDLYDIYMNTTERRSFMNWNTLNADNGFVTTWYRRFYNIIFRTNVIIDRAEADVVEWASEEEKNAIIGEAKFLRAYAYTFLANMWGGVPLVLEETTEAKFDYIRASQTEVYNQSVEDLLFAVSHMNTIDNQKGGRAPRAASYHLLTQIYIQMDKYQEAINAATQVIDDPNYQLMTERFGRYKDFEFRGYQRIGPSEPWGDVYWDLFRDGNFNRIDGNTEVIWNIQMDFSIPGGGNDNQFLGDFKLEYALGGPALFKQRDRNGLKNWRKDINGGNPIGWYLYTNYYLDKLWQFKDDADQDIRNSEFNIQRTWYWHNPESEFFQQPATPDNIQDPNTFDVFFAPSVKKFITTKHYGGRFTETPDDFGRSFKDWYIMRLAETYLLRAEAHHLNGDNAKAAIDINAVRNRAQATPVESGEVNLDLILDERARELLGEEYRLNTLMRMGKLPEYLMKYNGEVVANGYQLGDHLNKFPIPNSEIEANNGAVLEQNPGY